MSTTAAQPATGTDRRRAAIRKIEELVCKDRPKTHGDFEDDGPNIATIWNVVVGEKLKTPLDALDVAAMMSGLKLARLAKNKRNEDNWLDNGGYAACGAGYLKKELEGKK